MSVQNIECQIAKGQIGRYLAGDAFSGEAMTQLEAHIAECPGCQSLVAERRAELLAKLGGSTPTHALVEAPASTEATAVGKKATSLADALRTKAAAAIAPVPAAPKPSQSEKSAIQPQDFKKPIIYSVALAAVLVGMSYASKAATGFFGPKANAVRSTAIAAPAAAKTITTPPAPAAGQIPFVRKPVSQPGAARNPAPVKAPPPKPKTPTNAVTPASTTPKPSPANVATATLKPAKPAAKPTTRRVSRKARTTRRAPSVAGGKARSPRRGKIRVYDPAGAPIS